MGRNFNEMHKIRKYRLYDKYNVDIWGWLMHQRSKQALKILLKLLFRQRILRGFRRRKWNQEFELWKSGKLRKGFGRDRSVYKKQLQEKQKTQFFYGFVREQQLKRFYEWAKREKGLLVNNFSGLLESRLLSIAYRMGFFDSMRVGVQYILHHGLVVEGKRVYKYNYTLLPGQKLEMIDSDLKRIKKLRDKMTDNKNLRKFFLPFFSETKDPQWHLNYRKAEKRVNTFFWLKSRGKSEKEKHRCVKNLIQKGSSLWHPPGYLEVSYPLMLVMLVYHPSLKEIFYPYKLDLNEVVCYYKYH